MTNRPAWFLRNIDTIADELVVHGGKVLVDVAVSLEHIDQRRIQPDSESSVGSRDSVSFLHTLTDD